MGKYRKSRYHSSIRALFVRRWVKILTPYLLTQCILSPSTYIRGDTQRLTYTVRSAAYICSIYMQDSCSHNRDNSAIRVIPKTNWHSCLSIPQMALGAAQSSITMHQRGIITHYRASHQILAQLKRKLSHTRHTLKLSCLAALVG